MIILPAEILKDRVGWNGRLSLRFRRRDGGQLYSAIHVDHATATVPGSIQLSNGSSFPAVTEVGCPEDEVRIITWWKAKVGAAPADGGATAGDWQTAGYVLRNGTWEPDKVTMVPVREELYSRSKGLLESSAVAGRTVFVAGEGSVGSRSTMELAVVGVNQILMDHDHLEVCNLSRHVLGLSDVGRLKVVAMAEKVLDKNPYATVETCSKKITWDTQDIVRQYVHKSDLTLCAIDDRDGKTILNRICVEEGKPLIMAGAFRRAYGGQVLFVKPHEGPCYQCFLMALPAVDDDREISSEADAALGAYADRPVAIEPGLSVDIGPISLLVAKLAIQHLLGGQETTLRSLDEDLIAPWLLWLNRREAGTDYEHLGPLGFEVNGMRILRWYGIDLRRNPTCPVCGDFLGHTARLAGIELPQGDASRLASPGKEQEP